jgi:uncharacterized YigZ family protein
MDDTYLTIESESQGLFKDKGSKFLAFAYPVQTEEQVKEYVQQLRKSYFDARHHCYAFRLGHKMDIFRAADDGEPSGTAGRPILGQIQSRNLTNVLVVVVRYFGGTLLGTSGLIQAYKAATADALDAAKICEKIVEELIEVTFQYEAMNEVMRLQKDENLTIISSNYDNVCKMTLSCRTSKFDFIVSKLEKIEGVYVEKS